jgi:acetylornithine/succinyldiaminopimelate/putrescine aminotransferase
LPIGAMLVSEEAASGLQPGDHGSTFGGSPIPAAAALAHLQVRDEIRLEAHVQELTDVLFAELRELAQSFPEVFDAPRGMGALAGLPVREPLQASELARRIRDRGVLVGTAGGNTLRFAPPLIVTPAEIRTACKTIAWLLQGSTT